jgi:hypothetical protein
MKTYLKKVLCLAICLAVLALPRLAQAFSMAAIGTIDLKGNGIASDSFDSSDPNYSTNGLYTPLRRKAGGDIVTNNTITNSVLSVGNANIAGHVITGPNGSVTIGTNGTVGDLAWVSNSFGIEPGWWVSDLDVYFADVVLPNVNWSSAGGAGTGGSGTAPDGYSYAHIFTSPLDTSTTPGNYVIADSGDIYVGTNVSVRLNVTANDFKPNKIYVAGVTTNDVGKLVGYLNGPAGQSATLGTNTKTQSGKAENLAFFGLPHCTSVAYKGNGDFAGVIYAPEADFQLAGGGAGIIDFIGSSVTKTVQLNGHYHFHFDENLSRIFSFENPIFISRPQNQTVVAGQNATFSVSATSSLPVSYQWNFRLFPPIVPGSSSVPIPGATNSTLTVTNVTAENQGSYSVVVSNAATSATSSSAFLTVLSPVPVLSQPVSPAFGEFQFDVVGIAGSNYAVLASTNCVDWVPVITNSSPFTFVETNASSFPARFYRAVYVP